MGKRKKFTFSEWMMDENLYKKYEFYDSYSWKVKRPDGKFCHGILYKLSERLQKEDKNFFLSFCNTLLFVTKSEYAPEQVCNVLFIGNSALR